MDKKQPNPKTSGKKEVKKIEKDLEKSLEKKTQKRTPVSKPKPYVRPNTPYSLLIQGPPASSRLRASRPVEKKVATLVQEIAQTPIDRLYDFLYDLFNEKGRSFLSSKYPRAHRLYLDRQNLKVVTQPDGPKIRAADWEPNPVHRPERIPEQITDLFYKVFGEGYTPGFEEANKQRWFNFEKADALYEELKHRGYTHEEAMNTAYKAYSKGETHIKESLHNGHFDSMDTKKLINKLGVAVTSFGGHTSPHQMHIEQKGTSIKVRGNLPLCRVQANVGGTANFFGYAGGTTVIDQTYHLISLSADGLGGRLALISSLFTLIKYNKMKMRYTPSCSTSTAGANLAFGFEADPGRENVSGTNMTYEGILQLANSCTTAFWQPCELEFDVHSDWMFVTTRDFSNISEERQVSIGALHVESSDNLVNALTFGTVDLEYEVELAQPCVTYGLTLFKGLEAKYSTDSVDFVMEKLLSEPDTMLDLLKTWDYKPPDKLDPVVLDTLKAVGFCPRVSRKDSDFEQILAIHKKVSI